MRTKNNSIGKLRGDIDALAQAHERTKLKLSVLAAIVLIETVGLLYLVLA